MRVVVICAEPDSALDNPDSVASQLRDLGCRVTATRFDLGDLDQNQVRQSPPTVVVFEALADLPRAVRAAAAIGKIPALADKPSLVVIGIPRLPGLDFSAGFDDFILAPLVPAELYARLRQLDWKTANFGSEEVIKIEDLLIDIAGYEARLSGRLVDLTHQEFELLRFLAQNRGRAFSRDQLLQQVWGYRYGGGTRTVDIHVRRVRSKLGPRAGLIVTVRNVGYKMRAEEPT